MVLLNNKRVFTFRMELDHVINIDSLYRGLH